MDWGSRILLLLLAGLAAGSSAHSDVVELTDYNFDQHTASGIWFIDVYAPWCLHCQQLSPIWEQLATEVKSLGINVGKADGTTQKVIIQRLGVMQYPSLFLLRDGQAWTYESSRTVAAFKEFALQGYKDADPMPWTKAPNSSLGRLFGKMYSFPALLHHLYLIGKEDWGLSDLAIVATGLLLPVFLGTVVICLVDTAYVRKTRLHDD